MTKNVCPTCGRTISLFQERLSEILRKYNVKSLDELVQLRHSTTDESLRIQMKFDINSLYGLVGK